MIAKDSNAETDLDKYVDQLVSKSICVETFGIDYGAPETHDTFNYTNYINQLYGISGNGQTIINSGDEAENSANVEEPQE